MLNDIEKFLLTIKENKGKTIDDELVDEAQKVSTMIKEEFKNNIIYTFGGYLNKGAWCCKEYRKYIKDIKTKIDFIDNFGRYEQSFIEKNWNKVDVIIKVLKDYVNKLEAQEAEEQQNNEQTEEGESNDD